MAAAKSRRRKTLEEMRDNAVSFMRRKRFPKTIVDHNVALFHELASSINSTLYRNPVIDPYCLLYLALYHENLKSSKSLPQEVKEIAGELFGQFVRLRRFDVSEKKVWSPYSDLSKNIPLLVFRTIDLSHLPNNKRLLISSFGFSRKNINEELHNLAQAALYVYTPFADILGLSRVMDILRNYSSRILYPTLYMAVENHLALQSTKLERVKQSFTSELNNVINEAMAFGISILAINGCSRYKGRIKRPGSIVMKLLSYDLPPEKINELHDMLAFTVVAESREEAYLFCELLVERFGISEDNVEDFIKNPRGETGYQSIHANVSYKGINVEVQIKSREMYERCEKGDWAHALFKPNRVESEKMLLLSKYSEFLRDASTEEVAATVLNVRSERIKVHVAKGSRMEEIELPKNSCVFDLICMVSDPSKRNSLVSAATGRAYSLFDKLREGGCYRINVDDGPTPPSPVLRALLHSCITVEAKSAIKSQLRKNSKKRK